MEKYPITQPKSNTWNFIKWALIIVLLGFTIYLCFRNHQLNSQLDSVSKSVNEIPDTVYKDKPFKPVNSYSDELNPWRILIFGNKSSSAIQQDSTHSQVNTEISRKDSLVQFTLDNSNLNLSFWNKETGTYHTNLFNIDLDKYKYNWYEGTLTQKRIRKLSLSPYAYGKYRPFNNLLDVGVGISFKTKRFNYKLGVNTFYYPRFHSGIGTDLEFTVTYNF